MSRSTRDVSVWYWPTESLTEQDLATLDLVLSDEERQRRDRLRVARNRRDFTAAHALLRMTLSRYDETPPQDWRFLTDSYGKPCLAPGRTDVPSIAFNLSHTDGLVACAIGHGARLGVDVERCDRMTRDAPMVSHYFAPTEVTWLAGLGPEEYARSFTELWTLKEAYLKGLGLGLSHPLNSFAFEFPGATGLRFTSQAGDGDWHFWLAAPSPATRLAVCVDGHSTEPPRIACQEYASTDAPPLVALRRTP